MKISIPFLGLLLLAALALPAASPKAPDPGQALRRLLDGNRRYVGHQHGARPLANRDLRQKTARKQTPFAVVLACSDSRVAPELIFDQRLGDLFVIRVAGNVTDPVILGSIEYAVLNLGTPLVLVLGHSNCGAVAAAVGARQVPEGNLGAIVRSILPAVEKARAGCGDGPGLPARAAEENVRLTQARILADSPVLALKVQEGHLKIQGGSYDLETGRFHLLPASPH